MLNIVSVLLLFVVYKILDSFKKNYFIAILTNNNIMIKQYCQNMQQSTKIVNTRLHSCFSS